MLRLAGFLSAKWALPKTVRSAILKPSEKLLPQLESEVLRPSICKQCPCQCMLQVRVVNGRAVGVAGMPEHPVSRGHLCPKGYAILQELYHPDRLRRPLRRKGRRGAGNWEPVSWEEVLKILRDKLSASLKNKNPRGLGILTGPLKDFRRDIIERFARSFGTERVWELGWAPSEPPHEAFAAMHGGSVEAYYDLPNAEQVFSFGWDWLQESAAPIEAQRVFAALRRGKGRPRARILQIEPRLSISGNKADEWISLRPGTEGALALGIAHVLIQEGLSDQGLLSQKTVGYEEFKKIVIENYGPDSVSQTTGVPKNEIRRLARALTSVKASLAITNRRDPFTQTAVNCLNVLIGGVGMKGGVRLRKRDNGGAGRQARLLPEALGELSPSVEILLLDRVNPVFLSPQPERWRKTLKAVPFIVSFSSFLDESSQLADLVLPFHTSLESWQDARTTTIEGNRVRSFTPPAVRPLHDTREIYDLILDLSRSLGKPLAPTKHRLDRAVTSAAKTAKNGASLEDGKWSQSMLPDVKAPRKVRFPVKILAKSAPRTEKSGALRLQIFFPLAFSFGEGAHLPYLHDLAGAHLGSQWETWVELHPETAARLGISDQQPVFIETSVGKIRARARLYEAIRHDTVAIPFGMGRSGMGRFADGVGSNPGEIVPPGADGMEFPLWEGAEVKVYAA